MCVCVCVCVCESSVCNTLYACMYMYLYACVVTYMYMYVTVPINTSTYMQLSLYLSDKVSKEGVDSVTDKRPSFEQVHSTNCCRLTKLLVARGQPLHYGSNEVPLTLVLGTGFVNTTLCDVFENFLIWKRQKEGE